jgi:hypothetical protein
MAEILVCAVSQNKEKRKKINISSNAWVFCKCLGNWGNSGNACDNST